MAGLRQQIETKVEKQFYAAMAYMRWWLAYIWSRDLLISQKYPPATPFIYGPTWHTANRQAELKLLS